MNLTQPIYNNHFLPHFSWVKEMITADNQKTQQKKGKKDDNLHERGVIVADA